MTRVQGSTMAEKLTTVRSRVRQHHTLAAAEMLDTLIAEVTREAKIQRIVNAPTPRRSNGRKANDCRFGYKYGAKGQLQRNRKHQCGPECAWNNAQVSEWLRTTPYKIAPGVEILSRLAPVPPCANCNRRRSDHWEAVANDAGLFVGFRAIQECSYRAAA